MDTPRQLFKHSGDNVGIGSHELVLLKLPSIVPVAVVRRSDKMRADNDDGANCCEHYDGYHDCAPQYDRH
jgi:hypothetical protein